MFMTNKKNMISDVHTFSKHNLFYDEMQQYFVGCPCFMMRCINGLLGDPAV